MELSPQAGLEPTTLRLRVAALTMYRLRRSMMNMMRINELTSETD